VSTAANRVADNTPDLIDPIGDAHDQLLILSLRGHPERRTRCAHSPVRLDRLLSGQSDETLPFQWTFSPGCGLIAT
jgi:hypothetical protein